MGRIQGNLLERTFRLARGILDLVDHLPNGNKGWEIGRQLIRSGTSVGANVREADHAQTAMEFVRCCSISRRESSETQYWLELCVASNLLDSKDAGKWIKECDEITRVLAAIVKQVQSRDNADKARTSRRQSQ